ncbi:hypothetical protein AB6D81_01980 [Vibrio splendidus]
MVDMLDYQRLSVRRDSKFESLEHKFCATKGASKESVVFSTLKEFMVFAALVGYQLDEYQPIAAKTNTGTIQLDIYASTGLDAYIYLIALAKNPSLDILKDENLKDAIEIFESYCNAGLANIDNWVMSHMSEPLVSNVLFNQTLEYLIENE